jgi:hypothetical protein
MEISFILTSLLASKAAILPVHRFQIAQANHRWLFESRHFQLKSLALILI